MTPSPLVLLVLVLAAYRVTRLIGWDDLPPIQKLRDRATGVTRHTTGSSNMGLTDEKPTVVWSFKRPLLAHFLGCAFCQGFWVSAGVYAAWVLEPRGSLYVFVPFAVSGAVGLITKNLDK